MIVDTGSLGIDGVVIEFDTGKGAAADYSGNKGIGQLFQFAGYIVFLMEVRFVKDGIEDVRGQDVLHHHFADVLGSNGRVDYFALELEKFVACL